MPKPPDIAAVIAEMRASAAYHRGRVRPPKPLLRLPEGAIDVTAQTAGKTFALIGAAGGKSAKIDGKSAILAIDPEDDPGAPRCGQ